MASILKITDGTTTVDFLASAGTYRVASWAPEVAGRRASELGGRGPYEDVVEEMVINVAGATPGTSLETLQTLLDQATRWGLGEPVSPVRLHYKPTSGSDELKACIIGPAKPGAPMLELPPGYVNSATTQMISPIRLRFRRTGAWLGATVAKTSDSKSNPLVMTTTTLTAMGTDCPMDLDFSSIESSVQLHPSYFLVTSGTTSTTANRIFVGNAKDLATGVRYTSVADAGTASVSGNVLRYTCNTPGTEDNSADLVFSNATLSAARRYAIFINVRNVGTGTFNVQALLKYGTIEPIAETPITVIEPTGYTDPTYVMLGIVSTAMDSDAVALRISGDTAGQYLSFDSIAVMAVDKPATDRILALVTSDNAVDIDAANSTFGFFHQLLDKPYPTVLFNAGATWTYPGGDYAMPYRGDPMFWLKAGDTAVKIAWLGTGGNYTGKWRVTWDPGTALVATTATITQTKAYLIPR